MNAKPQPLYLTIRSTHSRIHLDGGHVMHGQLPKDTKQTEVVGVITREQIDACDVISFAPNHPQQNHELYTYAASRITTL